ncbi:MAG: tRNA (adenine-N1)-methyltransferase [Vulcanisaeta sp.]|jgi:tRNA (adenine57-N1/adenine58-N1)-methyltransferase|uniref:Beta-aspartate methyltransferase n=1 Tax=Vulcanisaeta moutnovskia (strain 768-28) TaxID=985053 RepID=F0QUD8_VULM7|nr:tRNA (adenine-N1)-methyltransferase [Vulcanisaeta moutnovskia]ADY01847.1 beta-aspartate methyltransferase [Vulcanisaeta moutnovskia 768-28]
MPIKEGDYVLIVGDSVRSVVRIVKGSRISTIRGIINTDDVIGREYGTVIKTNLGYNMALLRPLITDILLEKANRITQVIYPKDAAQIIINTGIGPGSRVAEAGVGSGFMTAMLAYYVKPNGKIYGYDKREDSISVARKNLEMLGLIDWVELRLRDVTNDGFLERDLDAVVLDMGDPWNAIPKATEALRSDGVLVVYVPTVNQVLKVLNAMNKINYVDIRMFDVMVREWKTEPTEVRPQTWINAHTGYLIIGRRTIMPVTQPAK